MEQATGKGPGRAPDGPLALIKECHNPTHTKYMSHARMVTQRNQKLELLR